MSYLETVYYVRNINWKIVGFFNFPYTGEPGIVVNVATSKWALGV